MQRDVDIDMMHRLGHNSMLRITSSPLHLHATRSIPLSRQVPRARDFSSCPFQILGLKRNRKPLQITPSSRGDHSITYDEVQTAFRELALKHHPDTNSSSGNSSVRFTRIREAFEAIAEGPGGIAMVRNDYSYTKHHDRDNNEMEVPDRGGNNEHRSSFQDEQNGFLHPSVNPQILHEVAEVAEKMNPGGLGSGMWAFANMIRYIKDEGKGLPPLRVGGSDDNAKIKETETETRVRRRRRRK